MGEVCLWTGPPEWARENGVNPCSTFAANEAISGVDGFTSTK